MMDSLIEIAYKYHLPVDPYFSPNDSGCAVDGKRAQYYGHMLQIFVHKASLLSRARYLSLPLNLPPCV